jgi:hypothetical protein
MQDLGDDGGAGLRLTMVPGEMVELLDQRTAVAASGDRRGLIDNDMTRMAIANAATANCGIEIAASPCSPSAMVAA